MKNRLYIWTLIGLLGYNIFFSWAMGRSGQIAIPAYPIFNLKLIIAILLLLATQLIIFIPILKVLWNTVLVKHFLFNPISYFDSIAIYTFAVALSLILRQHNILVFLIRLCSK